MQSDDNLSDSLLHSKSRALARCGALCAAWVLFASASYADTGPFKGLGGEWSGGGSVSLGNGGKERINCRATYEASSDGNNLQQRLRCASDSYKFELSSNVIYVAGQVSGTWTEASRNMSGVISGRASGSQFEVIVTSPSFSANLSLTTHGNQQSIVISAPPGGQLVGASINMTRK
ncbi:MAG TPA: hypothetical protein VKT73_00395 [Xanthobacteraceae bacterium]|nr:hypothetical protein [Xanthobacteraceae bacterium]